ncbi:hypothetical protein CYMTET_5330 [Cymbomonas tetramitiformis]|uniref:Uncharacterized protein n=1 Tax=Cymbomonas tetramitiformis TaxID=36881 RepID=A0AAE0F708_9CHLO|nr:hypothetical protein CYMTET_37022 [Cymbomonas tetramitiformis]KAK3287148.1 hypothetical protein CYMTET_5330 [Cymbomonas tetramitiformis]
MAPKRCRSLSPSMLRCSTPGRILTAPRRDRYSSPEPTPRSSPTSPPGAPKKKPRHEARFRGLSMRYALDRRPVYASDGSVASDSPAIAARRNEMAELCLAFGSRARWSQSNPARQEETRRRLCLRPECPCCRLDIEASILQERPDGRTVPQCERHKPTPSASPTTLYSGNVNVEDLLVEFEKRLESATSTFMTLKHSITKGRKPPSGFAELARESSAKREPERVSNAQRRDGSI